MHHAHEVCKMYIPLQCLSIALEIKLCIYHSAATNNKQAALHVNINNLRDHFCYHIYNFFYSLPLTGEHEIR